MKVSGIIAAMVTPLTDTGEISLERTKALLDKLLKSQISGVFILGTNGEAYMFDESEKLKFAKFVIDYVGHRINVYVGTGLNSTGKTIAFSQKIAALHPDALSVITPFFVPPTQDELIHHYTEIANNVDIPILIYNIPGKTGVNVAPDTVAELSKNNNIIGIKDSSGKLDNMQAYLDKRSRSDFAVLAGSDSKILELLKLGGDGAIAATANVLSDNDANIFKYYQAGNLTAAAKCQAAIEPLRLILHGATTPGALKVAIKLCGIDVGPACAPCLPPSAEQQQAISAVITDYKNKTII
ncbi:dihydrodipicolinate synthase family protein [Lactiplantibacillus pentosus]|jgi:4-hydroxy-tetrahydrodipicolinate synthase|uniref:dihydrodipicolinate synthase family protein n=1 Tax=Lactiplantibacillus pentosus TaxID=1589 RepID=UPI000D015B1F|nr:dihydrodipicolinate synthase family protein [Lactiplantibacillus pentosus]MCB5220089.1 dihydrodipicolinate synthase family protein [Lactiplantibacillus pentosus]MCT3288839.1 dihydrodipicolinate synthase family protein [Lactiplantibacillus pentosus]MDC6396706.1 dihydrodipicolinate synthase family protein [Lactiplantibacillus pentosus]PRO84440.1 dihydrodipicolinate synthase family protein [Lactiplantibacillus pentosus]